MKRRLRFCALLALVTGFVPAIACADRFDVHIQKGTIYAHDGERAAAIKQFEAAKALKPKNPDVHYSLGVLYGCPDGIKSYEEAIHLDELHWQAMANLGRCREAAGQLAEADALYLKSLQINPRNPELQFNVGMRYLNARKFPQALQYLKAALDQNPAHYRAALNAGHAYVGLKDTRKAMGYYNQAIVIDRTIPDAYINLAGLLTGNRIEAQKNLEKGATLALDANNKAAMHAALVGLETEFPHSTLIEKLKKKLKMP